MENKLNHQAIQNYCEQFTNVIIESVFENKDALSGSDILKLTPVQQVNYFVVKQLFVEWRLEMQNLKSPFFDFKSKEVKKALRDFMNTLSNHIALKKNEAKVLLNKATLDSLMLIFSPYDYFCHEINNPEKTRIKLKELEEIKKYVRVNQMILGNLIDQFKREGVKEAFNDEAFRILNDVFENISELPEEVDQYYEAFSAVIPLTVGVLYKDLGGITKEEATHETEPTALETEPARNTEPVAPKQEPIAETPEKTETPTEIKEVTPTEDTFHSINERFAKNVGNLNEEFETNQTPSLGETLGKNVENKPLIQSISINQRFMFLNGLFEGNNVKMESTLNQLDQFKTLEEVNGFLSEQYPSWNKEEEEYVEFLNLLKTRHY